MLDNNKITLDKFNGEFFWVLEDLFYWNNKHELLTRYKLTYIYQKKWDLLDRQILGFIRLLLMMNVVFNILKAKTIAELMETLKSMYKKLLT